MLRLALFFFFLIAADASAPPARGLKLLSAVENRKLMRAVENSKAVALVETGVRTRTSESSADALLSLEIPTGTGGVSITVEATVAAKVSTTKGASTLEANYAVQLGVKIGAGKVFSLGLNVKGGVTFKGTMAKASDTPLAAAVEALKTIVRRLYRQLRSLPPGKTEMEIFDAIKAARKDVGSFYSFGKDYLTQTKGNWQLTEQGHRKLEALNAVFVQKVIEACDKTATDDPKWGCDPFGESEIAFDAFQEVFLPKYSAKWGNIFKSVDCDPYKNKDEFFQFLLCSVMKNEKFVKLFTAEDGKTVFGQKDNVKNLLKAIWGRELKETLQDLVLVRSMQIVRQKFALGLEARFVKNPQKKNPVVFKPDSLKKIADDLGLYEEGAIVVPVLLLNVIGDLQAASKLFTEIAEDHESKAFVLDELSFNFEASAALKATVSTSTELELKYFAGTNLYLDKLHAITEASKGPISLKEEASQFIMAIGGTVFGVTFGDGNNGISWITKISKKAVVSEFKASLRFDYSGNKVLASILEDSMVQKVLIDFIQNVIVGEGCKNLQKIGGLGKALADSKNSETTPTTPKKSDILAVLKSFGGYVENLIKNELPKYLKEHGVKQLKKLTSDKIATLVKEAIIKMFRPSLSGNKKMLSVEAIKKLVKNPKYVGFDFQFDFDWSATTLKPRLSLFSLVFADKAEYTIPGTSNKVGWNKGSSDTNTCAA